MAMKKIYQKIFLLIICLLYLASYITPFTSKALMVDEDVIIKPLEKVNNLSDYLSLFQDGKIYDFQPVRDISHYIDILIINLTGFTAFPLIHNIFLLIVTSVLLYYCLKFFFSTRVSIFLCFFFFTHPMIYNIYVAYTSRKHILSFIFILAAFYFFRKSYLNSSKEKVLSYTFYLLSLLSQPINALFIILKAYILFFEQREKITKVIYKIFPYFVSFFVVIGLNFYFYYLFHTGRTGVVLGSTPFQLDRILLSISLHYKSFFIPFFYSRFYSVTSYFNLTVLILLPLFLMFVYKINRRVFIYSSLISLGVFITLYGHKSNVLNVGFQTYYALANSFSFLLLLGILVQKKFTKYYYLVLIPLVITCHIYGAQRSSKLNYFIFMEKIESECRVLQSLTTQGLYLGYTDIAAKYGKKWLDQKCLIVGTNQTYKYVYINTMLIYISSEFSYKEKEFLFKNKFSNFEDKNILLAGLEFQKNKNSKTFYNYLNSFKDGNIHSFFLENFLGRDLKAFCKNDKHKACKSFLDYVKRVKDKKILLNWKKNIPHFKNGVYFK
jgi:hypothetical protein